LKKTGSTGYKEKGKAKRREGRSSSDERKNSTAERKISTIEMRTGETSCYVCKLHWVPLCSITTIIIMVVEAITAMGKSSSHLVFNKILIFSLPTYFFTKT
jgi:hypothetical protein